MYFKLAKINIKIYEDNTKTYDKVSLYLLKSCYDLIQSFYQIFKYITKVITITPW